MVHSPSLHLPFFPINSYWERHDLANAVARQRKNTNIWGAAMGPSRLFKRPKML